MTDITLIEVGPRDGLQNESKYIPLEDKINFIHKLNETGLKEIEITSFVSEKAIPQLKDAKELANQILRKDSITYSALVPNIVGMQDAVNTHIPKIAIFTAASNSFTARNIHCTIEESIERFIPVIEMAKAHNILIRGYISCVLGCPYEGHIQPKQVITVSERLLKLGVDEISYGDTIGVGTPKQTEALVKQLMQFHQKSDIAMHFHDTFGQAIANIYTAIQLGVKRFDASTAGLGGCPYARGASGNVAMEDVLYLLHGLGLETGIDIYKVVEAGDYMCKRLNKPNPSKVANALLANPHHHAMDR